MGKGLRIPLMGAALALYACMPGKQLAHPQFRPPSGHYKLVVIQPDISVGVLLAGGDVEPHEDWTNEARKNIAKALVSQQARRGGETRVAMTLEEAGGDPAVVADLMRLHALVSDTIRTLGSALPTKSGRFDWMLGEPAVAYGAAAQYDYALFLHTESTFASAGRTALRLFGSLSCLTGVCVSVEGGKQTAFASLVDLKTGRIVWINDLSSEVVDVRTSMGAEQLVSVLFDHMKPGSRTVYVRGSRTNASRPL